MAIGIPQVSPLRMPGSRRRIRLNCMAGIAPCKNPRAVILIAHGNAGHVASRDDGLKYLQASARVSVFIFD
jgi:hypothetical protein